MAKEVRGRQEEKRRKSYGEGESSVLREHAMEATGVQDFKLECVKILEESIAFPDWSLKTLKRRGHRMDVEFEQMKKAEIGEGDVWNDMHGKQEEADSKRRYINISRSCFLRQHRKNATCLQVFCATSVNKTLGMGGREELEVLQEMATYSAKIHANKQVGMIFCYVSD